MNNRASLLAIGDTLLDVVVKTNSGTLASAFDRGEIAPADIEVTPGGTAFNLAIAASDWFKQVHIAFLSSSDLSSDLLLASIERLGVRCHPIATLQQGGTVVIVHDGNSDQRAVFANVARPSPVISFDDLSRVDVDPSAFTTLFIDSRPYIAADSLDTTLDLLLQCRSRSRVPVRAVDILPHDAYRILTWSSLEPIADEADIVIVEARTIAGLLGLPSHSPLLLADKLTKAHPSTTFVLRFGEEHVREWLEAHADRRMFGRASVPRSRLKHRGFGETLTAERLARFLRPQTGNDGPQT